MYGASEASGATQTQGVHSTSFFFYTVSTTNKQVESAPVVALATSGNSDKKRSFSEVRMRSSVGKKLAVAAGVEDAVVAEGVVAVVTGDAPVVEGEVAKVEDRVVVEVEMGDNPRRQRMPSGTSRTRLAARITIGRNRPTRRIKFDTDAR